MQLTFIETKTFTRKMFKIWDENLYFELQEGLLQNPDLGDLIPHGEGLRKGALESRRARQTRRSENNLFLGG